MSGYYKEKIKIKRNDDKFLDGYARKERFISLNVNGFDDDYNGTAEFNGKTVHISNSVIGDSVKVYPFSLNKEVVTTKIEKIETPSENRVKPSCKYFPECGNCNLLHQNYEYQLGLKTKRINKIASKYKCYSQKCIPSLSHGSRNKAHFTFLNVGRKVALGFFNEETHEVVPIKSCAMQCGNFALAIEVVTAWANEERLSVYNPKNGSGLLRFAVCRIFENRIMVTIVATEKLRSLDKLYLKLTEKFSEVTLYQNVNFAKSNEVFSDEFIFVDGAKKLHGSLLGVEFDLGANSFYQVNDYITSKIYTAVLNEIKESDCDVVIDAYSGIGITSALFAKSGKKVISIEIVKKAVEDAKEIASKNGVYDKIKFIAADCVKILPKLKYEGKAVFFVDPPRKGLGSSVCKTIIGFAPEVILYLSCNPESLNRDLEILVKSGYKLNSVTPYDMFPNTKHVETLCVLEKV